MLNPAPADSSATAVRSGDETALRAIRDALRGLEFGTVTAIVQDGVVIQVDRTEKKRLARRATKN